MPLTDEQRRRIEENKQKAIEKRRNAASKPPQPSNAIPSKTTTSFYGLKDKPSLSKSPFGLKDKPSLSKSPFVDMNNRAKISGKCVLATKDRFYIDINYQSEVIELFKQSRTGQYNAKNRNWSFKIEEHDELLRKLRPLQASHNVHVESLPKLILNTMKNFESTVTPIKNIDLNRIESSLLDVLMPFQRDGVIYALQRGGRILLADDMGLGKTLQALAIASYFKEQWPLLIVCPSSVRFAWRSAVIRWLQSIDEDNIIVVTSAKDPLEQAQVVIISYDLLHKKQDELVNEFGSNMAILDESHLIKSSKSARTKAAEYVLRDCRRVILLSGTPALSRPIELYPQISIIDPKLFPYVTDFAMRYCDGKKVLLGPNRHRFDFSGSSNMEELKLLMLQRFMIRRLKSEVLSQLPSKQRQMIVLDPNLVKSKSREMQTQARQMSNTRSGAERHGLLLEWYHTTANAKSAAVQDYIKDLVENGRKFICFAHHNTMLNDISDTLDKAKVHFIRIDGSTNSVMRKHLVDAFQCDDNVRVALLSITAANSGLTLTSAHLVVFAELFWNPGILTQAEDRAHRIGQTDSVTVQYLVAKGTADDELWPMIQRKLDVLNKAGLSKDNFTDSHSTCVLGSNNREQEEKNKITDYFSVSLTEEDLCALDDEWDGNSDCKKRKQM